MTRPDFTRLNPTPGMVGFGPRREPRAMPAPKPPTARPAPAEPPPPAPVATAPEQSQERRPEAPSGSWLYAPQRPRPPGYPTLRDGALLALAVIGPVAPYEEIVMRAWTLWPEVFGLRGYEHKHPDARAVTAKLSTLRDTGLVTFGRSGWRLTPAGARRARMLAHAAGVDLSAEVML